MTEAARIALVRHGYDDDNGHLTPHGESQADRAAGRLVEDRQFLNGVILTSTAPRAIETSERIAVGMGEGAVVIPHPALLEAGVNPRAVENLIALTSAVMEATMPDLEYDGRLIMVTHTPLIQAMVNVTSPDYGGVYFYEGDGHNPAYRPGAEVVLQRMFQPPPA